MNAREILRRYLRQQLEAGEREIFLDELDTAGVLALLNQPGATEGGAAATAITAATATAASPTTTAAASGSLLQALAEHAPGVLGRGRGPGPSPEPTRPAADPGALRILGEEVAGCTNCRLHAERNNVVFGEGNAAAEVVIVGEAPGREEDKTGRPFVGPAGKLLDLLLQSAGLPREEVYICNVLKCRPPENRDPARDEVEACSSHLRRQLDVIRPTVLLALGKFAAQTLAGSDESIGALRGGVHSYLGIPLVVTYHPAFLLRSPQWTRAAWGDLQLLREVLETRRRGA